MALGYFKVWRQLENSDLWRTDPLTIKIWLWILMHVCHKEQRLPNLTLQPGELITTYAEIMKAMVVPGHGFRKKFDPSLQTVRTSMQALCDLYVIAKQQAPQQGGLHIKVLHWAKYQSNDGSVATGYATDIVTDLQQTSNTIQEGKEGKEQIKSTVKQAVDQTKLDIAVPIVSATTRKTTKADPRVDEVWAHWSSIFPHRFSKTKGKMIADRLKEGFTVEEMIRAIDAFKNDDFPDRGKFLEIKYCFGTMEKLEKWSLQPAKRLTQAQEYMIAAGLPGPED